MAVQKRSISFDPEVLSEVEDLARAEGISLSGFVNRALERRVKLARMRELLKADEREFGPVPDDDVRDAVRALWPG